MLFVTKTDDIDKTIDELNKATIDWTMKAARGECAWICADCSCSFQEGMPDECIHGHQRCTDIIKRDKALAHNAELTGPQQRKGNYEK